MNTRYMRRAALALTAATLAFASFAQSGAANGTSVEANLKARFTQLTGQPADTITSSPALGLYEITSGTRVFYVDRTGTWLVDGHVVNLQTKTSITQGRLAELQARATPAMDLRTVNYKDAIKMVKGNPTAGRILVAFEDGNCSFCKKLHAELQQVNNITLYVFPVTFLGPQSKAINETVWCSADKAGAWAQAMGDKLKPKAPTCDVSAIDRNSDWARNLKVDGTPTLFFANGKRISGFVPAAEIEKELARQAAL